MTFVNFRVSGETMNDRPLPGTPPVTAFSMREYNSNGQNWGVAQGADGAMRYQSLSDRLPEDQRLFGDIRGLVHVGDTVYFQALRSIFALTASVWTTSSPGMAACSDCSCRSTTGLRLPSTIVCTR